MISPNRENIDRWLFDYTEGNLSADQEALLENFILNNPEIEVDLESWQESKLVSEEFVLNNKENYKRKRKVAPIYITSFLLILAISSIWIINSAQSEQSKVISKLENSIIKSKNKKHHLSAQKIINNRLKKVAEFNPQVNNGNDSRNSIIAQNQFTKSENNLNLKQFHFTSNPEQNNILFTEDNQSTNKVNFDQLKSSFNYNSNSIVSDFIQSNDLNLPISRISIIDSKSLRLDYYQIRNEELNITKMDNEAGGINLNLSDVKLFRKIGKILEKDLGLSNIPDHTYAIPEYSNVDVLFSNIGSTSQFRIQSNSSARWIENVDQRKLSQQISIDGYSRGAQSGFGLQANYDYFANGSIQNWNTCLLFSPKIAISKSISFEPALRLKIGNKILNEERIKNQSLINFESQTSNQFNFDTSLAIGRKLWYRDLDLGFTINTPYIYLGGQVSNVLRHQNNIYSNYENLEMRAKNVYNLIVGTQYISRNQKIQFSPYCFFERINSNRLFAGFSMKLNKLILGGSYGTGNSTTGTLGLSFRNFAIYAQSSYAYAPAIAKKSFIHQLTVRFNSNIDKKSRRYISF